MMEEKVSIIVPMYNSENYIERCLKSILNQSYANIEIVVVNDGSTDNSLEICEKIQTFSKAIKIVTQENMGCSISRRTGIKNASGKYIGFVDSDDWIEKDAIEKMIKKFDDREDVDIVAGGYVIEDDGVCQNPFIGESDMEYNNWNGLLEMFTGTIFNWSMCDKLYRKELYDNLNEEDYWSNSYGEDTYKNYKLFKKARGILFTPVYGYHYCLNLNGMMRSSFNKDFYNYIDIYQSIYLDTYMEGHVEVSDKIAFLLIENALYYLKTSLSTYDRKDKSYRKYLEILKKFISSRLKEDIDLYRRRLEWLSMSEEESMETRNEIKRIIIDAANESGEVWMYGAGVIAREVVATITQLNLRAKVIVTEKKNNMFEGFKVFSFEEAEKKLRNGEKLLMAMNNNNCNEIIGLIGNTYQIINIGKYSYYY